MMARKKSETLKATTSQKKGSFQNKMSSSTLEVVSNWFNVFTVALGIAAGVAGAFALYFSNRLNKIKDTEFAKFKQESLERIAIADSVAAKANERAAEANQKAEEEKLARVKIEKQLAPRTLSESDMEEISKKLRLFTSHFSGRKIKVSSYMLDAEGIVFALTINDIIFRAGIETDTAIGRALPVGLVDMGVKITAPVRDSDFILKLAEEIFARLKNELYVESKDEYKELSIEVGVKPVAGLPKMVFLNKQPQQ